VICKEQSEAGPKARRPFEVIEQAPQEIAVDWHTFTSRHLAATPHPSCLLANF
jgi:hypothetical protein